MQYGALCSALGTILSTTNGMAPLLRYIHYHSGHNRREFPCPWIAGSHNHGVCCLWLLLMSRLLSCRASGCCGESATAISPAWEHLQATRASNNTIGASLTKNANNSRWKLLNPLARPPSIVGQGASVMVQCHGWVIGPRHSHNRRPKPEVYFWRLRLAGLAMIACGRISFMVHIATESAETASLPEISTTVITKAGGALGPLSVVFITCTTHDATTDIILGTGYTV